MKLKGLTVSDLSDSQDLILFLIQRELKFTKLMMELNRIGMDGMPPPTCIEDLIFSCIGFEKRDAGVREEYYSLVESYAKKIELFNPATASEQALNLYWVLRKKFEVK